MSFRKLTIAGLIIGLMSFGASALAQQPQTNVTTPGAQQRRGPRAARRGMRQRARRGGFPALRELNLTDAQQQQARSIMQANFQNTKAQRDELRQLGQQWRQGTVTTEGAARAKELRKQLADARSATFTQLTGILTAEQKAKLEELRKTRRANHEMFKRRKQGVF